MHIERNTIKCIFWESRISFLFFLPFFLPFVSPLPMPICIDIESNHYRRGGIGGGGDNKRITRSRVQLSPGSWGGGGLNGRTFKKNLPLVWPLGGRGLSSSNLQASVPDYGPGGGPGFLGGTIFLIFPICRPLSQTGRKMKSKTQSHSHTTRYTTLQPH